MAESAQYPVPLTTSGILDSKFKFFESTPVIGREYPELQITRDILNSPDADALLRDLAITISERGVVFLRAQEGLTAELQAQIVQRMGELCGKPSDSSLHIHPLFNDNKSSKDALPVINFDFKAMLSFYKNDPFDRASSNARGTSLWHSDVQNEPVPPDYSFLRLVELPETGGDTLWASGYEIYERLSPAYRKFVEGLTATFEDQVLLAHVRAHPDSAKIFSDPRGNSKNAGTTLQAVHPVVRTNPITGWKSVFAIGLYAKYVNELTNDESAELLKKFYSMILNNHDLQVRLKWKNPNDIAIWDNRCTFHAATTDFEGHGKRFGIRATSVAEEPYLDPNSRMRTEVLLERKAGTKAGEANL